MAMSRFFLCFVVAWSCVALLAPLVQARVGPFSGLGGSTRPAAMPFFQMTEPKQQRGMSMGSAPSWSAAPGRGELRSVPAGPDPLHHHSSPMRPEQEHVR